MTTHMTAHDLPVTAALRTLPDAFPPGEHVLSIYLEAGPQRAAGPAYLLAYRDGCKALRAALPPQEQVAFAAAAQAEHYLTDAFSPGRPGVALFTSRAAGSCYAVSLPAASGDEVSWRTRPQLEPLYALLDTFERVAVALVDKERARLLTVFLGQIETHQEVVDVVPGKQATGGWFALAQTRYARHHEEHVRRHVTRTCAALLTLLRTHPFERLLVGGPPEAVALLQAHLPRPLRARLAGTLSLELFASDGAVLQATLQAAEDLERHAEMQVVEQLSEGATTPHAVLGVEATLGALHERRIHRLVIADTWKPAGGACTQCGRLTGSMTSCPACRGVAGAGRRPAGRGAGPCDRAWRVHRDRGRGGERAANGAGRPGRADVVLRPAWTTTAYRASVPRRQRAVWPVTHHDGDGRWLWTVRCTGATLR